MVDDSRDTMLVHSTSEVPKKRGIKTHAEKSSTAMIGDDVDTAA